MTLTRPRGAVSNAVRMREALKEASRFSVFLTGAPACLPHEVVMSLFEQIDKDYVQAYKAKETVRIGVLRLLKTAVKNRLVDLRRPGGTLSDEEMLDVIIKEGKQRQDSIEQYTAAGRPDLAEKEAAELAIIQDYLPKALSPEELNQLIEATISEVGATTPRDMGKVISSIMATHKGRVDGKVLSEAVKARLTPQ